MSKKKIILSVINNYRSDQRVQKVAHSLIKFGFDIEIVATDLRGKNTNPYPYKVHYLHLKKQVGPGMYAEFNKNLFQKLKKITQKEDVLLANDLDALLPNYLIKKLKGCQLVFDSHEIYSELPSLSGRKLKKGSWKLLEKKLIPKIEHFYTVSNGYADWFENAYGNRPKIIRNVPSLHPETDPELKIKLPELQPNQKLIIYQGAVNISRGIDKMIQAMKFLENSLLLIIGDGPLKNEYEKLTQKLSLNEKVKFLGNISPGQLRLITPKADLGLSLEEDGGLSYRYALPNKIFDFMHAGVPILGTWLPEIKQTIEDYKIGEVIENHHPEHIAQKIQKMLNSGKEPYLDNLKKASVQFNWENEEKVLKEIYSPFF